MVTVQKLRALALGFPDTTEENHFEKISFRIRKKIFATYDEKNNCACIKLAETDQAVFSLAFKLIVYPVPNKWGKQGWTFIEMTRVKPDLFIEMLTIAYCKVAPETLARQVRQGMINK